MKEFTEYLKQREFSPATIEAYPSDIENCIKLDILDKDLSFFNESKLLTANVSTSTKKRWYGSICKYSKFLIYTGKTIVTIPNVRFPKVNPKITKVVSYDEFTKIINKYSHDKELHVILLILYSTGCRVQSLVNLKIEDIDFTNNSITFTVAKGCKEYQSILTDETKEAIKKYINNRQAGYIFQDRSGNHITEACIRKRMERGLGPDYINPHALRHSICTTLIENNADIVDVKAFMNHTNIQTTTRYIHLSAKAKEARLSKYHPLLINDTQNINS